MQQKIHFLNDEFGSVVRRWPGRPADMDDDDEKGVDDDDERNVRFEVFFYFYQGIAFTVFWPTKRIEAEEEVLRWFRDKSGRPMLMSMTMNANEKDDDDDDDKDVGDDISDSEKKVDSLPSACRMLTLESSLDFIYLTVLCHLRNPFFILSRNIRQSNLKPFFFWSSQLFDDLANDGKR